MAEAVLNVSLDRCIVMPPITCGDANIFEKGAVESLGAVLVAIVAAAADGATQRAVDVAAGLPPRSLTWAPVIMAPDVTMLKLAGEDSIAIGTKLWWSEDDNVLTVALASIDNTGVCKAVAVAIELSNDTADTVRVAFDGRMVADEAGTG